MGAQASIAEANTKIISKAINNSIIESAKSCSASTSQNQTMEVEGDVTIGGRGNTVTFSQESNINLSCIQDSTSITELRNTIKQEITNKLKAENSGQNIGGQMSMSSASSDLITEVVNSINMSDMQACFSEISQSQNSRISGNLDISGTSNTYSFDQSTEIVSTCMQKNQNLSKLVSDLSNSVANDISASNTGFIGGGALILFLIIILLGMGGYAYYRSGGVAGGVDGGEINQADVSQMLQLAKLS